MRSDARGGRRSRHADTRSWSTLPARVAFGRVWVKPGTHTVWLGARSVGKSQRITLRKGGFGVVNPTVSN